MRLGASTNSDCNLTCISRISICYRLILLPSINGHTCDFGSSTRLANCLISIRVCVCSSRSNYCTILLKDIRSSSTLAFFNIEIASQNFSHNLCVTGTNVSFVGCNSCLI